MLPTATEPATTAAIVVVDDGLNEATSRAGI
jgi:hypothetical protein